MEGILEAIAQAGGTGGVVAALLLGFKSWEAKKIAKNGGTISYRIKALETEMSEITEKLNTFHRDFCEFREEMRLRAMRDDTIRDLQRRVQNE